ncbi:MAG: MBL fold metallo-hydrolase [Kiritimatiellae bacterium]|nr:MBL fold metallo-hydrolase [Kiritimatiellia bacterium]
MQINTVIVGAFEVNCYILFNDTGRALVIDPGADADRILEVLRSNDLTVVAYLLTHGHIDHISAVAELVESLPAPVAMHQADMAWAFDAANQMPPFYFGPKIPGGPKRLLRDGEQWNEAGLSYTVLATPGHTPGSVCFLFSEQNLLFSGDTLFAGSVGRTDLPGGEPRCLMTSLKRLSALPAATVVYPGHGPTTTIGQEVRTNYFMRGF